MKKTVTLLLAVSLVLSLCACSAEKKTILQAQHENYIRINNLDTEAASFNEELEEGYSYGTFYSISGLKDKDEEDAINQELKGEYDRLLADTEIPSYRGSEIYRKKYADASLYSSYCYESIESNAKNILSVCIESGKSVKAEDANGEDEYFIYGRMEGLNYDLNTGEKILITDLFPDAQAGLDYINSYIYNAIDKEELNDEGGWSYDWSYSYKIIDFEGIDENQKFYISCADNGIYLILDEDTPWAVGDYDSCSPKTMYIPLEGIINAGDKYDKGSDIFENETPCYNLVQMNYDADDMVEEDVFENDYEGIPNFYYSSEASYAASMPEAVKEYVSGYAASFTESDINLLKECSLGLENRQMNLEYSAFAQTLGSYSIALGSAYMDVYNTSGDDWDSLLGSYDDHFSVLTFDNETGEIVSLEDLFTEGYDIDGLLKKYEVQDNMYFYLQSDALVFRSGNPEWNFISVPYSEIGCENMTIFNMP